MDGTKRRTFAHQPYQQMMEGEQKGKFLEPVPFLPPTAIMIRDQRPTYYKYDT
jgi:hypothetical protein